MVNKPIRFVSLGVLAVPQGSSYSYELLVTPSLLMLMTVIVTCVPLPPRAARDLVA